MSQESTTAVVQRLLDALAGDTPPEPIVHELLERAVRRLELLSGALLRRSYPRLTQPPLNVSTEELLGGVVAGLLSAMQKVRPRTAREFFGLAAHHMRWQLNDLARRLDKQPALAALQEEGVAAPPTSGSALTPDARRMLDAIDQLPEDEREAFNLVRIQGLTFPEAAGVVGVSTKTLQRRLNRARVLLAEQLADLQPRPPSVERPSAERPSAERPPPDTPAP
jgi:RNA polymerase sigma factor (sigma-70 family)